MADKFVGKSIFVVLFQKTTTSTRIYA